MKEVECYAACKLKLNILYTSELSRTFIFYFPQKILAWEDTASTENPYQFSALQFPFCGEIKPLSCAESLSPSSKLPVGKVTAKPEMFNIL